MKHLLIVMLLSAAGWAQNIPAPDIVGATNQNINAMNQAQVQAAQAALLRQQAQLLKQQAAALKQQSAVKQQPSLVAAPVPSSMSRKPRIDDLDPLTKQPKFATFADYEDAKDEWLIEEAMRRFQALQQAR